jgi:hypothetical protein
VGRKSFGWDSNAPRRSGHMALRVYRALRAKEARRRWLKGEGELTIAHANVCEHGVDCAGRFVQSYGSDELDASLLTFAALGPVLAPQG